MESQKLQSSDPILHGKIPEKWQERFLIKRIDEQDIEISLPEQQAILRALNAGQRYVQVGKYTLMLNGIKSIDPKWGEQNIPPRPKVRKEFNETGIGYMEKVTNQDELDEWDRLFGKLLLGDSS